MKKQLIVAPSILSADFLILADELKTIEEAGAKYIHFDVMDGHFVPNISFGIPLLDSIVKAKTKMINDVHIMISDPLKYGPLFARHGADIVTFHYEAVKKAQIEEVITAIKQAGSKVGISIKPNTNVKLILPYLKKLDLVLVMSVEPGFGGQSFMANSLDKIKTLRRFIDNNNLNVLIEVDGGINKETAKLVKDAGVDIVVAGSYLFGKTDIKQRIAGLISE